MSEDLTIQPWQSSSTLTSIGVAVLAMIGWLWLEGDPLRPADIVVFVVVTLANAVFVLVCFRAFE